DSTNRVWYLGGNISVSGDYHEIKKKFIEMGFTNVFPKPVSFQEILSAVNQDLQRLVIHKKERADWVKKPSACVSRSELEDISDAKWSRERLSAERRVVLSEWKTGRSINPLTASSVQPEPKKNLDAVLWEAKMNRRLPLLQPRTGVADVSEQIEILQYLEQKGSDVASVQLDAASRSKLYAKAEEGVNQSRSRKVSVLNGFPVPVHGVEGVRKIVDSVGVPFQLRAGGPDHRFVYEIALQAGVPAVEGGFICYLFPYDKTTRLTDSLRNWQYVDRLCAWYMEHTGISINREYFGTLTANLIEPAIAIVVNLVQSVLSARQGARSISVGYAEQGNRSQDIAAIDVMEQLTCSYLAKYGMADCRVTTVYHQYMAAFPRDEVKAEQLIHQSAITAALAHATKMMTKSPVEAFKIPSKEENARGLQISRQGRLAAAIQKRDEAAIDVERWLIKREVIELMDVIEECGNGSLARGTIVAFQNGYFDIPFSPHNLNRNEVVTLRDSNGAVRFAAFANLPLSDEVKDFHFRRIEERKKRERDSNLFSLLEKDLSRIWKNDYQSWPLDQTYIW
ncbi:MAG TPA: methylaspartate mutase subunit E, partial [Pyrinomonadaceae bacterium]|nr:methylaspartate mutase subunit E [Pyrinomonadaceae bacterium]